jgi:hypothetical protein
VFGFLLVLVLVLVLVPQMKKKNQYSECQDSRLSERSALQKR